MKFCYDKDEGIFHYHVITKEGEDEIVYRRLNSFPWVVSQYMKASGEKYGRGPVAQLCMTSRPSTNSSIISRMHLSLSPVFIQQWMMGFSTQMRSDLSYERSSSGAKWWKPRRKSQALPRSGDPQLSQMSQQDLVMSIKQILMDDMLPPDTSSARSATEIYAKDEDLI